MTDNITVFTQNSIRITDGDRRIYIDPYALWKYRGRDYGW